MTDLFIGVSLFMIFALAPTWFAVIEYLWKKQEEFIEKLKEKRSKLWKD